MMNKLWTTVAMVGMTALVGCQQQEKEGLAEVPPPPAYDEAAFDPVQVEPAPTPAAPATVEPAPQPVEPAPTAPAAGQTYTVKKGDTLWSIAERIYGDPRRMQDIVRVNNIQNPDQIYAGQELILP